MHTLFLMFVPPEDKWEAHRLIRDLVNTLEIDGVKSSAILDRIEVVIAGAGPVEIVKWPEKSELVAAIQTVMDSYPNSKVVLAIDPTPEESHAFMATLTSGVDDESDEEYEVVDTAIAHTAVVAMAIAGGINAGAISVLTLFARSTGDPEGVFTGAEELIADAIPLPEGWTKREDI